MSTFGKKIRNPSIIIPKLMIAIVLNFNESSFLRQRNRATNGESIKNGKGNPVMLCNFKGIGNMAGPMIKEYKDKNRIGTMLNSNFLHNFHKPIIKKTFKIALIARPIVNKCCVGVPNAPNSLTNLLK